MSKQRKVVQVGLMYLGWAVVVALGVWLSLTGRDIILNVLSLTYIRTSSARAWQVHALDKFGILAIGTSWLVLMIGSEEYFRAGVKRGLLYPRLGGFLGAEIVLLALVHLADLLVQPPASSSWLFWLLVVGEALVGGVLLTTARASAVRAREARRVRLEQARGAHEEPARLEAA